MDFSVVSPNQIDVSKEEEAMEASNSRADRSLCPPADEIMHDISDEMNELHENKVKRIKLMKDFPESEECSAVGSLHT